MRTPNAVRQRRWRRRHKLGLRAVQVEIGDDVVELLKKRGYEPGSARASIGVALTALLSDLVLEAIYDGPRTTQTRQFS